MADSSGRIFLSCLGTSNYSELAYESAPGEDGPICSTRFIQLARLKVIKASYPDVVAHVLVTKEARKANWLDRGHAPKGDITPVGLEQALKLEGLQAHAREIPSGANEQEFWDIFETVAGLVPDNALVHLDLTHGFRTLPVIVLLALEYVEKVKGATLVDVTYGADKDVGGSAPVWNLYPFLTVREWASAAEFLLRYGDPRPLADIVETHSREIKRQLRGGPQFLGHLPKSLREFGEAIFKCHAPTLASSACELRAQLRAAEQELDEHFTLKPFRMVLNQVEQSLAHFPQDPSDRLASLVRQIAAAKWCLQIDKPSGQKALAMQGFTFIREACVTALVAMQSSTSSRQELDGLFSAYVHYGSETILKAEIDAQVKQWNENPPVEAALWKAWTQRFGNIAAHRNKLDHAHTAESGGARPASDETLRSDARTILGLLDQVVAQLQQKVMA